MHHSTCLSISYHKYAWQITNRCAGICLRFIIKVVGTPRRQIPLCVARQYYLLFASSVNTENGGSFVLFRRWEPLNNFSADSPPPVDVMEDIEMNDSIRGTSEIRELHKYKHAPTGSLRYDLEGHPQSSSQRLKSSQGEKAPRRRPQHAADFSS